MNFPAALALHVGASMDKQLALADWLGEQFRWEADLPHGTMLLNGQRYPLQILGSESTLSRTWLWAWGNTALAEGVPATALTDAERVRAYGEEHKIHALTSAEPFLSEQVDGHKLALLSAGICGADAYFRAPYENGAAYVLLYSLPLRYGHSPTERVITVMTQTISQFSVAHGPTVEAYLTSQGFTLDKQPTLWRAQAADGRALSITWDASGRVRSLDAVLGGGPA